MMDPGVGEGGEGRISRLPEGSGIWAESQKQEGATLSILGRGTPTQALVRGILAANQWEPGSWGPQDGGERWLEKKAGW